MENYRTSNELSPVHEVLKRAMGYAKPENNEDNLFSTPHGWVWCIPSREATKEQKSNIMPYPGRLRINGIIHVIFYY